ncbi:DEAD/DEAH box helicase family protein [Halovenus rubra]|uniref:DEAD/DEAH box helicase family protein n=2 Tax=Halovenus rubra TaxID=869890 RepID=A0ACC7DZK6_9EURY|nr:DEAD/DEAH box helicase family protein [Halovenus rubra]
MDIDRALEAFLEKQAASAIDRSTYRDKNAGAGLRTLRNTDSVADLTLKLFSDPSTDAYAEQLLENLPDSTAESDELLRQLDEPRMTTPLWGHQRTALNNWIKNDQRGYVDMATATGKTVLGLAAIAYRYGELHPADLEWGLTGESNRVDERPRVLIVAGNEVILKQWRDEFDEHLDIPKGRTEPIESEDGAIIELDWGDIEFRTAQGSVDHIGGRVILSDGGESDRTGREASSKRARERNLRDEPSLSAADRRRRDSVATHDRCPDRWTATGRTGRRVTGSLEQPCAHRALSRRPAAPSHRTP